MPKLPDELSLGERPVPRPDLSIAQVPANPVPSALGGIGEAISQIETHLTEARRATDLTNALGAAAEQLGQKELDYKRDSDFRTIPTRFKTDAQDIGKSLSDSISDPTLKRVFQNEYSKLAMGKQLSLMQHSANMEADFNKGKLDEGLQVVAQAAARATTDFERANNANTAMTMIQSMEDGRWITKVEGQHYRKKFLQNVEISAVENDMERDPVTTYQRLTKDDAYAQNIDPLVRSRLTNYARQQAKPIEAEQIGDKAINKAVQQAMTAPAPTSKPAEPDSPFVYRIAKAESNFNMAAVSSKGAKSDMQVMDATARGPGYGVVPAKDNSLAERSRVGRDYAAALLTKYGGNETLAAAAYNAGPGVVDDWITGTNNSGKNAKLLAIGDPRTGEISDADFVKKIPYEETRKYVPKVASFATQLAGGLPQTAKDAQALLGPALVAGDELAEQQRPGDLTFRDMVRSKVKNYVGTVVAAQKGVENQAVNHLMGLVAGTDGGAPPITMAELLGKPGARDALVKLDGGAVGGILNHIDANNRRAQGLAERSEPGLLQRVVTDIYAGKITQPQQLVPYIGDGTGKGLSVSQFDAAKRELASAQTPEGTIYGQRREKAIGEAAYVIRQNPMVMMQPTAAHDAVDNMRAAFIKKEDEYRKAGKDTNDLLDPSKPDYFFKGATIGSFLPSGKEAVAKAAEIEKAQAGAVALPDNPAEREAEYNALPPGAWFSVIQNGRPVYGQKAGGKPAAPAGKPPVVQRNQRAGATEG